MGKRCFPIVFLFVFCYDETNPLGGVFMQDIWPSLKETFDTSLPRMTAIVLKENDYDLGYYCPSLDNRSGCHFGDTHNFFQKRA